MQTVIVIPARMGSTRFPGKPLCKLQGKPMVQWVFEAATLAGVADRVVIATPDAEIVDACRIFGAESVLTSFSCVTGTDRIAEVARKIEAEVYINVQGDEPLMPPKTIERCARLLLDNKEAPLASCYDFCDDGELDNPAVVKVVTDSSGDALYFSRYPIPFPRNPRREKVKKHIGIYGYRRAALLEFANWPMSALEEAESLEQLRFLEKGLKIKMAQAEGTALAVDTLEQAEEVDRILSTRAGQLNLGALA